MQLSLEELDIDQIFINSEHSYELVLANKGDIDAMFTIVPASSTDASVSTLPPPIGAHAGSLSGAFSGFFRFTPGDGIVTPGNYQAISVTFRSTLLGNFRETFYFQIDGSPQKLQVTFMYARSKEEKMILSFKEILFSPLAIN